MSTYYERCTGRDLEICEDCKRRYDHVPEVPPETATLRPMLNKGGCIDARLVED